MRLTAPRMLAWLLVVAALSAAASSPWGTWGARFVAAGDGVVRDRRTGLTWTNRNHDRALAWDPAARHCRELVLGDRSGWRLPEITELQALHDEHAAQPCGNHTCRLDTAIRLESPWVWSATARFGGRFYFDFAHGSSLSPGTPPTLVRRVLCVRGAEVR